MAANGGSKKEEDKTAKMAENGDLARSLKIDNWTIDEVRLIDD